MFDPISFRLSPEALALIQRRECPVVDLRPLLEPAREHGPAVVRAAMRWGMLPEGVVR
jgi:hypothetical protein